MSSLLVLLADASGSIKGGAGTACSTYCNTTNTFSTVFGKIATTLTFLVGAISVIMVIVGGLRYVLSNGDSKATVEAKNTIMYALIGVVVAIAAYAIVSFVTTALG